MNDDDKSELRELATQLATIRLLLEAVEARVRIMENKLTAAALRAATPEQKS